MTRFATIKNALLAGLVVGVLSTTLWWFGGFPGLHWPHFRFGGWQAANTTNQQTGTVKPLDHRLVYLDGVRRVINPTLQQVRTGVESEGCILVYNRAGRFVGKSCAGANETISGLGYSAKTESGIRMMVFLTVCPLGSPGFNSGSCN